MAEDMILDGGIMIATAAPAAQQIVYLDFDGELTSYNGEILTVDEVEVKDSSLTENALQKLLTSTYRAYSTKEDDPTEYLIEEFYFTDIIYAHNGSLEYNMQKLLNSNKDKEKEQEGTVELLKKSDELKGLIKTAPWAYEKEVRLIVKLAQTEDTPEKIAVKFPDNAQGISVTLGPVNSYIKLLEVECGKSSLTNQISNEFTARFI